MVSKSKVRSMQRGAAKRNRSGPIDTHAAYSKHPPRIVSSDKPHLDFLKVGKMDQFERIVSVIEAAQKND